MTSRHLSITIDDQRITKSTIRFSLCKGEHWYLSTDSGVMISNLFDWLEGKRFLSETNIILHENDKVYKGLFFVNPFIKVIRFSSTTKHTGEYYQQRYNATENDNIIKLCDFLNVSKIEGSDILLAQMGLDKLLDESVNMLSTGEYIKATIIKAAYSNPSILFIEDPYPGLDKNGRYRMDMLFENITNKGTSIVMVGSGFQIPCFLTHAMVIDQSIIKFKGLTKDFPTSTNGKTEPIPFLMPNNNVFPFNYAFELMNVKVQYGERTILKDINWRVKNGEKWQLLGNNGAGKSLLLSLIYADNPQVYANSVTIFDRKRGTGESIWDIKEHIGYYSSELFRYFNKSLTIEECIHSIVDCNPYRKKIIDDSHVQFQNELLRYFNLSHHVKNQLYTLSPANQRIALLIAVLIKDAPLLILDEPFQNFDQHMTDKFLTLLHTYTKNKTLIFVSHNSYDIPKFIKKKFQLLEGNGIVVDNTPG